MLSDTSKWWDEPVGSPKDLPQAPKKPNFETVQDLEIALTIIPQYGTGAETAVGINQNFGTIKGKGPELDKGYANRFKVAIQKIDGENTPLTTLNDRRYFFTKLTALTLGFLLLLLITLYLTKPPSKKKN